VRAKIGIRGAEHKRQLWADLDLVVVAELHDTDENTLTHT
jgi:hypothetical protein